MVTGMVNVKVNDRFGDLKNSIAGLMKKTVLVGIPEDDSERGDIDKKKSGSINRQAGELTNAELAYIHTHGIRKKSMREEMQRDMNRGAAYSRAYQMYIQSHGSPLWHSPPRPIIEPAIEENKEAIGRQYGKAIKAALDGNDVLMEDELHGTGQRAENFVKKRFEDPLNGWPLNTPATIEAKDSDSPLIDTGQLRKSITHVVRNK